MISITIAKVAQSARVEIYCPLEQRSPNDAGIKHAKDITQISPLNS